MGRPIHFELSVDDPDRAVKFYTEAFGWKIERWPGPVDYWLITTGPEDQPGIDGGLTRRDEPTATTVNTIAVDDVDRAMARIVEAGGSVVTPRMAVPGVGYMAYCIDTEGNRLGVMQEDPTAR